MKARNQLPKLGASAEGFKHPEKTPKHLTPPATSHVKPRKKQKAKPNRGRSLNHPTKKES